MMVNGFGICVCGLNGCGKTTFARALASEIGAVHFDIEDYYFTGAGIPYSSARTREEVGEMLEEDIKRHPRFVFSAVNGNMTDEINSYYDLVIYLYAPKDVRNERVRQRAFDKFGDRVRPGGDMYESEEKFFAFAAARTPEKIESWLSSLSCRVIRLDGTKPIDINAKKVLKEIQKD